MSIMKVLYQILFCERSERKCYEGMFAVKILIDMPKFLFTVISISVILWVFVVFLINIISPDNLVNVFLLLFVLGIALSHSFSIPLYYYFHKRASAMTSLKMVYRRSVKWSIFLAFGVCATLMFKAFDLINILNYGLFLVLYASLFFWLKSKRR